MHKHVRLTGKDFSETNRVAELMKNMDNIDTAYASRVSDEIFKFQPFFLSALLGLGYDLPAQELDEIAKIYFLIWEFFKDNPGVKSVKLTENSFMSRSMKNAGMFKYVDKEKNKRIINEIYATDLQKIKSKALLTGIILRFNTRPVLLVMDSGNKGI